MATLECGIPTVIDAAISAPGAEANFTIEGSPAGHDFSIAFQVVSGTTISADLQISMDGGTTFSILAAAILTAVPTAAGSVKVVTPIVAGPVYRLNYTTATGTIKVSACRN